MATYNVTLKAEAHNLDVTISCPDDKFVLEAAEDENIELPYFAMYTNHNCLFNSIGK